MAGLSHRQTEILNIARAFGRVMVEDLAKRFEVSEGAALSIHKSIALAGGLAGGSADAAGALATVLELWQIRLEVTGYHVQLARTGAALLDLIKRRGGIKGIAPVEDNGIRRTTHRLDRTGTIDRLRTISGS